LRLPEQAAGSTQNNYNLNTHMTLIKAVSQFMSSIEFEVKPPTLEWYGYMLATLTDSLGDAPLTAVSTSDLRQWRKVTFDKTDSASSRNGYLRAVKRFFRWCVAEGLITDSPAERLKLLKISNDDKKMVELSDVLSMIAAARERRKWRDVALMLFLLGTGSRVSAVVALRVKDLDLPARRAWVDKKSQTLDAHYWVYLDEPVVQALRDYFAYERQANLAPDDYVFTNGRGRGEPLHRGSVWQLTRKYGDLAGIKGPVNPHAFRHAFAILQMTNGQNLAVVSALMGHSDIQVTRNSYGRFQSDQLRDLHHAYSPLNNLKL
jgi:integrase/recombinase XerD